ncbi:MAG: hypothetical protein ACK5YR_04260 [Pirellula sp.]
MAFVHLRFSFQAWDPSGEHGNLQPRVGPQTGELQGPFSDIIRFWQRCDILFQEISFVIEESYH